MRFESTIRLNGKTACGIVVPEEVIASLGSSRRPAVRVTIKGYTYRTTVAHMGGEFLVGVSAERREARGSGCESGRTGCGGHRARWRATRPDGSAGPRGSTGPRSPRQCHLRRPFL
ncbi:MAG: DUF1905 domain-containing protein, partial [Candidatus Dormibacteraeota bacterium]|nr:DUF1905 domain-containing protein [Candidatus Dormibacteraeota bacterium]